MNKLIIRKATIADASSIAAHIMLAMNDLIYRFTGDTSEEKALAFVEELVREPRNQYSYENGWVVEEIPEGEDYMHDDTSHPIIATAVIYDGARLSELREPVIRKIRERFHHEFNPEDETEAGELYIDCLGVNPNQQGKGIGTKLLNYLIEEYVTKNNCTLGLLVDKDNPGARQLYIRLGFMVAGEKTLTGKPMLHLQARPKSSES